MLLKVDSKANTLTLILRDKSFPAKLEELGEGIVLERSLEGDLVGLTISDLRRWSADTDLRSFTFLTTPVRVPWSEITLLVAIAASVVWFMVEMGQRSLQMPLSLAPFLIIGTAALYRRWKTSGFEYQQE